MKKLLLTGIAALFLATGTAHTSEQCVIAIPPLDRDGACDYSEDPKDPKVPVDLCGGENGHPLYYRPKDSPGLLHLRKEPSAKSGWIDKFEHGKLLWLSGQKKGWTYIWAYGQEQVVLRKAGWVRSKYIKPTKCPCPEEGLNGACEPP